MAKNGQSIDDGGPGEHKIKGVFSLETRPPFPDEPDSPPPEKSYWFAKELDSGAISIKRLDENLVPTGRQTILNRDEFLGRYSLEPELGYRLFTQKTLRGDYYRKQDKYLEAKIEYQSVLRIDEENIRANFGLGLTYLALNHLDKARYAFTRIVGMEESFGEEHKHLFNEFGIALRKKGLFQEAARYYARASELCPSDENIFLNKARALYESGDIAGALCELGRAFDLNPELAEGRAFLRFLKKNAQLPEGSGLCAYLAES